MRLFVALTLPGELRGALAAWGRAAASSDPALRPVPADGLHVTLAFLGEQPAETVAALVPVLSDALAVEPWPGDAALGGPLWLAPRRPHVLAVSVGDPRGRLAALQASVAAGIEAAIGWTPERRTFRAHITVARVRGGATVRRMLPGPSPAGALDATAVAVIRSRLDPAGARYEILEQVLPPGGAHWPV